MRSSFFGLNVAITGLYTAQRNLDNVSHNLSNVNTPGYSRQQVIQQAQRPMSLFDGTGMIGTGSEVVGIKRIHDDYLDLKFWSENIALGEWSVKMELLSEIERIFNEPSVNGSGFNKIMDDFYKALEDLSKDPGSLSARNVLINRGKALVEYFNNTAVHFEKLQSDINEAIKLKVDEINSLAEQIQQLNRQIYTLEADGSTANDLRDKRGLLVDQLSKLINIQVSEVVVGKLPNGVDNKHFVITVSGKALVDHFDVCKLKVSQRTTKLNEEDIEKLYDVLWEDGNSLEIKGGELKGYLDVRDGNEGMINQNGQKSPDFKGIPFYIRKLNEFVRKFALAINEGIIIRAEDGSFVKEYQGHADGYGLQKPGTDVSPTGIRFFTMKGFSSATNTYTGLTSEEFINGAILDGLDPSDPINAIGLRYQELTAKNFSLSGDLLNSAYAEYNIAASMHAGLPEDNTNILQLISMRHDTHLFAEGTPEDYMKSLVASLGIDSQQAVQMAKNQDNITRQIDYRRASVSQVSINEEMANLVRYQHAYNAAAVMISTMDEVYSILINRVGISGR